MIKQPILMTGATGLVGSRFVELFMDQYEIFNLDLTTGVDITDLSSLTSFVQAHPAPVMIHLAAFTDTNQAFAQTGDKNGLCYRVNVVGTENIVLVCKAQGIHLVHISTDFVFDGTKDGQYTETDPPNPIEWYGQTKALAEQVVLNSGISHTILRLSYPYRAQFAAKPDIVGKIRSGLETGKLYPQFSDTLITPTFIDDLAQAFAKVVTSRPQGIFHVVGSSSHSPYELAHKVAIAYGFDPSLVKEGSLTEYLKTASRPFARLVSMSNHKAVTELGLSFLDFDAGLVEIKRQQT